MILEQLWGIPIKDQIGTMLICTTDEGILSAIDTINHTNLWKTDLTLLSINTGSPRYLRLSIEPAEKKILSIIDTFTSKLFVLDPASGLFQ
jgi:hypothetical protein